MKSQFMLPRIVDYWDSATDAVPRFAAELDKLSPAAAKQSTAAIRAAIKEHLRVIPDEGLPQIAFVVAEDLYRMANTATIWNASVSDYLECSAGTFFDIFSQRGYQLHYSIDNSFPDTQRPLELFPLWFNACGIHYECPQLLEANGTPASQSRALANQHLREAFAGGRHYLLLDIDSAPGSFDAPLEQVDADGVLNIFRNEASGPGSKAAVSLSGKPGLTHI